jgi:hypothetical protein
MKSRFILSFFLFFSLVSPFASAVPITSIADPALAGATLLDFDSYTSNGYLGNFTNGNVSFVNIEQYGNNYYSSDAYGPGTSGRKISLYFSGYMTFSTAVSAVSFSLGAFNSPWTIQALNGNGDIIESLLVNTRCCNVATYGFATPDIAAIKLFTWGGDIIVMDDLRYVMTSVPEPSTPLLLLAGLTGLLFSHKRSKSV